MNLTKVQVHAVVDAIFAFALKETVGWPMSTFMVQEIHKIFDAVALDRLCDLLGAK